MKKLFALVLTIVMTLTLVACDTTNSKEDINTNENENKLSSPIQTNTEDNYQQALKAIDSKDYYRAYELLICDLENESSKQLLEHLVFVPTHRDGTDISFELNSNSIVLHEYLDRTYTFNKNGTVSTLTFTDERDEEWGYIIYYEYDENDRIIKESHQPFSDDYEEEYHSYTYDDVEMKYTCQTDFGSNSSSNYTDIYFCNKQSKPLTRTTTFATGITGKTDYSYNDKEQLSKIEYRGSDNWTYLTTLEYDKYGNVLRIYTVWSDGTASEVDFAWELQYFTNIEISSAINNYMASYINN